MSREILVPQRPVVHQVAHDVESYIWVLSYCVMRNLQLRAVRRAAPQEVQANAKPFGEYSAVPSVKPLQKILQIKGCLMLVPLIFPQRQVLTG